MPTRIQRRRTKGWRAPPNTIMCTRPGPFSNPFRGPDAVELFRGWLTKADCRTPQQPENIHNWDRGQIKVFFDNLRQWLPRLAVADHLACFCSLDHKCHVDVILEVLDG